jgi:hypothetical protein
MRAPMRPMVLDEDVNDTRGRGCECGQVFKSSGVDHNETEWRPMEVAWQYAHHGAAKGRRPSVVRAVPSAQ